MTDCRVSWEHEPQKLALSRKHVPCFNSICVTILKIYKTFSLTIYSFIVKLSERIQIRSTVSGASQRGLTEDNEFFHKTFPYFVWLLRDVTQSVPSDCKDLKEYFLKKVRLINERLIQYYR